MTPSVVSTQMTGFVPTGLFVPGLVLEKEGEEWGWWVGSSRDGVPRRTWEQICGAESE